MKKKTGVRSASGRPKSNLKLQGGKQRKRAKKKEAERPLPLWLQVFSRAD
jgi:hypothetical protein